MSRKPQLIRLAGSCVCLLASVFFCHRFSGYQYDALVFGAGFEPRDLPFLCIWFARYSPLLLAMPIVILWIGATRLVRRPKEGGLVELLAQIALVTALLLLIGCILAWQVPYAADLGALA
jgi:hypothetical protein